MATANVSIADRRAPAGKKLWRFPPRVTPRFTSTVDLINIRLAEHFSMANVGLALCMGYKEYEDRKKRGIDEPKDIVTYSAAYFGAATAVESIGLGIATMYNLPKETSFGRNWKENVVFHWDISAERKMYYFRKAMASITHKPFWINMCGSCYAPRVEEYESRSVQTPFNHALRRGVIPATVNVVWEMCQPIWQWLQGKRAGDSLLNTFIPVTLSNLTKLVFTASCYWAAVHAGFSETSAFWVEFFAAVGSFSVSGPVLRNSSRFLNDWNPVAARQREETPSLR